MDEIRTTRTRVLLEAVAIMAIIFGIKELGSLFGFSMVGPIAMVIALVVATVWLRKRDMRWRDLGLRLPAGGKQWLAFPLLAILAIAAIFVLAVILMPTLFGPGQGESGASFAFLRESLLVFLLFLIFVAWGTAAFGEEMLFRGFLLNNLEAGLGGTRLALGAALILQAGLFGATHFYQGWYGILLTGSIGLLMGIVFLIGKRWLLPIILAHGIIDTISLVSLYQAG
jgi:membrane protease YdiL (CAAX protease family)